MLIENEATRVLDQNAAVVIQHPSCGTRGRPEVPREELHRNPLDSLSVGSIAYGIHHRRRDTICVPSAYSLASGVDGIGPADLKPLCQAD